MIIIIRDFGAWKIIDIICLKGVIFEDLATEKRVLRPDIIVYYAKFKGWTVLKNCQLWNQNVYEHTAESQSYSIFQLFTCTRNFYNNKHVKYLLTCKSKYVFT